ncbi:unnamed protein product [Rotaria socialis]|nr:unnamed protein product [Rotaria socialis]
MTDLETDLRKFRFPSTTTRVTRTIMKYYRLKANESRVILLITYPIFKKYLKPIYYKHFQLLSFAMHIGESRIIDSSKLKEMKYLLEKFVFTFHLLYGKRHCVNTVHSVFHFHQTVKDYGPLTNYSTFNYESVIGQLAAATNGTKNLPREIENTLELIKNSSFLAHSYCTTSSLYSFISEIQGYRKTSMNVSGIHQTQKPISAINQNEKHELWLKFGDQFLLYNKCVIKGTSFTTRHYSKSKQFQDCGVLYQYSDGCRFGIINKVILITTTNKLLLQIHPLLHNEKDQVLLNLNTEKISCDHVEYGNIDFYRYIHIDADNVIEKVCYYEYENKFIFVRYPTLTESS